MSTKGEKTSKGRGRDKASTNREWNNGKSKVKVPYVAGFFFPQSFSKKREVMKEDARVIKG